MKIQTQNTQEIVLSAVDKLERFVNPTYGPAGKGVLVDSSYGTPTVFDDGFAVAERFELEDEFENAVVRLIKETSRKTNSRAGDGTTTSILLMAALVREVFAEGKDAILKPDYSAIAETLRTALAEATEQIRERATKIHTQEELEEIAQNSYKNPVMAKLIASIIYAVGVDGMVVIEDSDSLETTSEIMKGFNIDRGYISAHFATQDNKAELKNPVIIITDEEIRSFDQIGGLMEQAMKEGKTSFLIVAHDVTGPALNTLVVNKLRGAIEVAAIKAPGFAEQRLELLEDLAVFVGGKVFSQKNANPLSEATLEGCGTADKIIVSDVDTVLIGGKGTEVDSRVALLRPYTEKGSEFDREGYKKRIASLSSGIGVIRVGAHTDTERAAVKAKVDDAVHATMLAYKDGVVAGGGKTFSEIQTSSELFNNALTYPERVLKENGKAALTENAQDAAGVVIAALESATSIAAELITISGISTDKREEPKKEDYE